jgi:hypothetical protein
MPRVDGQEGLGLNASVDLEPGGFQIGGGPNAGEARLGPSQQRPPKDCYREVHVLLLSWKGDDLNAKTEIGALKEVFLMDYQFSVEQFSIPLNNPEFAVENRLNLFVNSYCRPGSLLIVYYGGHGGIDRDPACGPLDMSLILAPYR